MTINQVFEDGGPAVTADALNTFVQSCPTLAYAYAFVGVSGMEMLLQGFQTPGDGGAGAFYWNAGNTAPDDAGITTIIPNGSPGTASWTRLGPQPTQWTPTDASGALLNFTPHANYVRRINGLILLAYDFTFPVTANGSAVKIGGLPIAPNAQWTAGQTMSPLYAAGLAVFFAVLVPGTPNLIDVLQASGSAVVNSTLTGQRISGSLIYPT